MKSWPILLAVVLLALTTSTLGNFNADSLDKDESQVTTRSVDEDLDEDHNEELHRLKRKKSSSIAKLFQILAEKAAKKAVEYMKKKEEKKKKQQQQQEEEAEAEEVEEENEAPEETEAEVKKPKKKKHKRPKHDDDDDSDTDADV